MTETHERLAKCFRAVFPAVAPDEIPAASAESVEAWDSTTAVSLFNLIEEEFGIPVDYEAVEDLTSYQGILRYIAERQIR